MDSLKTLFQHRYKNSLDPRRWSRFPFIFIRLGQYPVTLNLPADEVSPPEIFQPEYLHLSSYHQWSRTPSILLPLYHFLKSHSGFDVIPSLLFK